MFLIASSSIQCNNLKPTDLCFPNENNKFECNGYHGYNCADFVCTRSQYSCHLLSLFSGLKGLHKIRYESFINNVADCPDFHWNPDNVCLNTKDCKTQPFHLSSIHRFWSLQIQPTECKLQL